MQNLKQIYDIDYHEVARLIDNDQIGLLNGNDSAQTIRLNLRALPRKPCFFLLLIILIILIMTCE